VIYGYIFTPSIDEFIGKDAQNIQKEAFQEVINDWYIPISGFSTA
jgi:hypothetical protein